MKTFLFGEDLEHWQIDCESETPLLLDKDTAIDYNTYHRVHIGDFYMYYDPTKYHPHEFNELATRLSNMQIFGTAFIITRRDIDFLSHCQHAPALPGSFRLERPTYPCIQ